MATPLGKFWHRDSIQKLDLSPVPMHFRSIEDMNNCIKKRLDVVARDVDFVVGIPRSGLLAANMIALHLNLPLLTINDLLQGQFHQSFTSRHVPRLENPEKDRCWRGLVVDDSINSGTSMRRATEALIGVQQRLKIALRYLAIYANDVGQQRHDLTVLEVVHHPRLFEWNMMHHGAVSNFLFDLDGVLCPDGPAEHSDDGGMYLNYITNAPLRLCPSVAIGAIVTSRLEKYRSVTEDWLRRNRIKYRQLIMLAIDTPEQRRGIGLHARYKAEVYGAIGGLLFVESEERQAEEIFSITRQPVYCVDNNKLYSIR